MSSKAGMTRCLNPDCRALVVAAPGGLCRTCYWAARRGNRVDLARRMSHRQQLLIMQSQLMRAARELEKVARWVEATVADMDAREGD